MAVIDTRLYLGALEHAERAKIVDATNRVLTLMSDKTFVRAEVCAVRPTTNPLVERLHIMLYFAAGSIACPRCEIVWVDDYEIAFLLLDDFCE